MKRVPLTTEQALERLAAQDGAVILCEIAHDDGCPTLATGAGADCNCQADEQFYELVDDESPEAAA